LRARNDEKQQEFTSKVRRGLVWVHTTANGELERLRASAPGAKVPGFTAAELADVEAALLWIAQNKESAS
jgi:hypothetical protein